MSIMIHHEMQILYSKLLLALLNLSFSTITRVTLNTIYNGNKYNKIYNSTKYFSLKAPISYSIIPDVLTEKDIDYRGSFYLISTKIT